MPALRHPLLAGALAVALLLAGCSDEDGDSSDGRRGDRPTADEVAAVLDTGSLDGTQLDCLAQAFVDSDMTDEGLQAIVDGGGLAGARGVSAADEAAAQDAAAEGIRCSVAASLPSSTTTAPTTLPGETGAPPESPTETSTETTAAG
jgi:hypothetical protein